MNTFKLLPTVCVVLICLAFTNLGQAQRAIFVEDFSSEEEFNYESLIVPEYELVAGGPGKDGIPAIDIPTFAKEQKKWWPQNEETVIGIHYNGVTKAYPINILAYHEIVNDDFGGLSVAVTYSPLCGSAQAFLSDRTDADQPWQFGVSGLLYNNNLVLFDRQTNSLWSQLDGKALSGTAAGFELEAIPTVLTSWSNWKEMHPSSKVLTIDTGFKRNYTCDAYESYAENDRLLFPVTYSDNRLETKERVLGVTVDGQHRAYPYSILASMDEDEFNGQILQFHYQEEDQSAYITDVSGNIFPAVNSYWFAWYGFHPDTEVHGLTPDHVRTTMSLNSDNVELDLGLDRE